MTHDNVRRERSFSFNGILDNGSLTLHNLKTDTKNENAIKSPASESSFYLIDMAWLPPKYWDIFGPCFIGIVKLTGNNTQYDIKLFKVSDDSNVEPLMSIFGNRNEARKPTKISSCTMGDYICVALFESKPEGDGFCYFYRWHHSSGDWSSARTNLRVGGLVWMSFAGDNGFIYVDQCSGLYTIHREDSDDSVMIGECHVELDLPACPIYIDVHPTRHFFVAFAYIEKVGNGVKVKRENKVMIANVGSDKKMRGLEKVELKADQQVIGIRWNRTGSMLGIQEDETVNYAEMD